MSSVKIFHAGESLDAALSPLQTLAKADVTNATAPRSFGTPFPRLWPGRLQPFKEAGDAVDAPCVSDLP